MNTSTSRSLAWLRLLLLSSLLTAVCLAQDSTNDNGPSVTSSSKASSSTSSRPSSTSSAPAQTHTVQVGLADHKFNPDVTQANVGDTVEFRFYPANHSVVRAEYGFPCIPYEMTGNNKQGFFSGFKPVDKVLDNAPKYSIKINDTNPIFFYCSAPGSCITYGMVGAINPNSSTDISTQQQKAKNAAYMLNPGEPFPAESPLPSNLPSSTSAPLSPSPSPKHTGLSAGAIAGIVIGALSVLILGALLFFFMGRSKTLADEVERKEKGQSQMYPSPPQNQQAYLSPVLDRKFTDQTPPTSHAAYILPPPGHPAYSTPPTQSMYSERPSTPVELPHQAHQAHEQGKLGMYGVQVNEERMSSAPPYGWHVNATPAEMEGTTPARKERARWEEVGREGEGRMF